MLRFKDKGFTLVELLIVIGVIGVLAGSLLIIINPTKQLDKSNDSKRRAELKQIQTALELYRADVGSYPTVVGTLPSPLTHPTDPSIVYLQSVPKDPSGLDYYYNPIAGGNRYAVIACSQAGTLGEDPDVFDDVANAAEARFSTCSLFIRYQSP
jgi:general secretion pathway protein G